MRTPPDLKKGGRKGSGSVSRSIDLVSTGWHQIRIKRSAVAGRGVAMSIRVGMANTYVCDNVLPSKGS